METPKQILITGGTGLLGVALQKAAPKSIQGVTTYFPEHFLPTSLSFPTRVANVVDREEMQSVFEEVQPDIVIHTAAIGSVDYAENYREATRQVNFGGTEVVVELCRAFNSRLIYISSNAVFDGLDPLYSESAPVHSINYYGRLKVEAENLIQSSGLSWAIVRPILMYGWPYPGERDNPVSWWVRSLREGKPLKVVDNVFSKPLPAWFCAQVIWEIIQKNRKGIYHVAGRDHVSLHQFAIETAQVFNLDATLITPVPDSYFPEIAPRPKDTSFDTTKIEKDLGVKPIGIRDGLLRMRSEELLK